MKWCTFFFAILLPAIASGQAETVSPLLQRHEAGIVCAPPTVGTAPAPDTVAGNTHLIDVEPAFVSTKRRVPAVLGIGFGVKAQAHDPAGIPEVTMTMTHPAMGKTRATTQTFQSRIAGDKPSLTFYQFDFNYEMALGTWHMEAAQGGKLLYRTTFEIVAPHQVPELARICGFEDMLS